MTGLFAKSILASMVVVVYSEVSVSQEGQLVESNSTGTESNPSVTVAPLTELQIACENEFIRLVGARNRALKDGEADFQTRLEELGLESIPNDKLAELLQELASSEQLNHLSFEQKEGQYECKVYASRVTPDYGNCSYLRIVSIQIEKAIERLIKKYHFDGFEVRTGGDQIILVKVSDGIETKIQIDLEKVLSSTRRGHKPMYQLWLSKLREGRNLNLLSARIDPANPDGTSSRDNLFNGISCSAESHLGAQQRVYRFAMADLRPILEDESATALEIASTPSSSPGHTLLHQELEAYELPARMCGASCRTSAK